MVTSHSNDGAIHLSLDTPTSHAPLDGFPEPPPWIGDAICATTDPEAFFPEKGGSTREAKAICASCTVQAECLDWALDRDERFGIWGGLSERERRRIAVDRKCRFTDCDQPTWSPSASHCVTHRPFTSHAQHDPAIHDSTTQESA